MTTQEATPFTALSLVPEIDGSECEVTCFESWGMYKISFSMQFDVFSIELC